MFVLWVRGIRQAFGRVFAYVLTLESYVFAPESNIFALESHGFARKFGLAYPLKTHRKDTTPSALFEILRAMKNVFVEDIAWIVVSFCLCLKWQVSLARFLHLAVGCCILHPAVTFINRSVEERNARTCTPRWRNW